MVKINVILYKLLYYRHSAYYIHYDVYAHFGKF